jgi:hypothetical protein
MSGTKRMLAEQLAFCHDEADCTRMGLLRQILAYAEDSATR